MIKRSMTLIVAIAVVAVLVPVIGVNRPGRAQPILVGRVHDQFQPNKGKIFVLVIGSDARNGNPNLRADAIHIAGINTKTMRGGILNFPRDSWVNIPGHGSAKINEALYRGGPRLLARTLEGITGIRLDYYALVGFEGFRKIIERVGPIPMHFGRGIYDQGGSGAHIAAGRRKLTGGPALAYVRTRKAFSGGDIQRTTNQARFLLAMLKKLRDDVRKNPAALLKWIAIARKHARLDIGERETFRLAVLASQVSARNIGSRTVPVSLGSAGGASVVFIQSRASSIYRHFKKHASL